MAENKQRRTVRAARNRGSASNGAEPGRDLVGRIVGIPEDVTLSPQAEPPREGDGRDRSVQQEAVRELTWARFDRLVRRLARQIRHAFQPDAVVGVAHGGLFVGGALASALHADFFPVRISRRSRDHRERKSTPRLSGSIPPELGGKRVLVVDDVSSSGDTLELAKTRLARVGAKETRTASLIAREGGYVPDWVALTTSDLTVFPWDYENLLDYEPERALDPAAAAAPPPRRRR